jgi:hypothetical protein
MTNLPLAFILSDGVTTAEVNSARPDAPVLAEKVSTRRTRRTRMALAGLLERAAATVAPPECSPAR